MCIRDRPRTETESRGIVFLKGRILLSVNFLTCKAWMLAPFSVTLEVSFNWSSIFSIIVYVGLHCQNWKRQWSLFLISSLSLRKEVANPQLPEDGLSSPNALISNSPMLLLITESQRSPPNTDMRIKPLFRWISLLIQLVSYLQISIMYKGLKMLASVI